MQPKIVLSAAALLLAGLAACTEETAVAPESLYKPTATIQDIMDAQVDPAADEIWNSVASIVTPTGVEEKQPRTDEEWEALKLKAFLVIEGGNLLAMPGRRVAPEGAPLDPAELAGETPDDIQKAMAANRAAWVQLSMGLHDAGLEVMKAIEAKSPQQLVDAGEILDTACENCHSTFWYPNAPPLLNDYNAPGEPVAGIPGSQPGESASGTTVSK
jgi:hypothetical protein